MKAPNLALALGACLALAGCSSILGGATSPTVIYAPQTRVAINPQWPSVPATFVVSKPSAPRLLDSSRIAVRPTANELQVYQGAAWSQSAPDMLQDSVLRTLEDSAKTRGAGTTDSGIRSVYKIEMTIRRFEADYDGGKIPAAIIVVNVKLILTSDQSVVASRTFSASQPSTSTQVAQVVQAFEQSLSQVTGQIVEWTLTSSHVQTPAT